jgi:small nuclear ribonucleoprotein F
MSLAGVVNPKPFLSDLVGKAVVVKLKWGMEYKGKCQRSELLTGWPICGTLKLLHAPLRHKSRCIAGLLVSTDAYMNFQVGAGTSTLIGRTPSARPCGVSHPHSSTPRCSRLQLANSEEFIDGEFAGNLGEILIRCNNVLYVRAAPAEESAGAGAAGGPGPASSA